MGNLNAALEKRFKLSENHTNVRTELLAGVTTFATMSYSFAPRSWSRWVTSCLNTTIAGSSASSAIWITPSLM